MNTVQHRLKSLRESFLSLNIAGILVTNPMNIRWLSGFTGSYGRLLITEDKAVLGTDSRYFIQAQIEAPDFELFQDNRLDESTKALLSFTAATRLGIEANHLTLAEFNKLKRLEDYIWIPLSNTIEEFRQYKTPTEISLIEKAASITDEAMALLPQFLWEGISEIELAWELEKSMREAGATGLAFPMIVAFGPNSALPHHNPGEKLLKPNEIVLIDMGAELNGYKSDLTRSFFFGDENEQFQEIFDLVLGAQNAALHGLRNGALSGTIHHLAMDVIAAGGYAENFTHGLGHGVGLDIHEIPNLTYLRPSVPIVSSTALTIEPGIYIEGWGGIRIEDLVVIDEDGFRFISKAPKSPFIHP